MNEKEREKRFSFVFCYAFASPSSSSSSSLFAYPVEAGQLESWTSVAVESTGQGLLLLLLLFVQVVGRRVGAVLSGAQGGPTAAAGQHQMSHLADDGRRIVSLL